MMTGAPQTSGTKPWAMAVLRWSTELDREPVYRVLVSVKNGLAPFDAARSAAARAKTGLM